MPEKNEVKTRHLNNYGSSLLYDFGITLYASGQ